MSEENISQEFRIRNIDVLNRDFNIYFKKTGLSVVYGKCGYEYEKYLKKNELKY